MNEIQLHEPQTPMYGLPAPDPNAAVSIRGLSKRFGEKIAVNGLSLDIDRVSYGGVKSVVIAGALDQRV